MNKKLKLKRILIPVDFSKACLQVIPYAEQLVDSQDIEFHLLHINQPEMVYVHAGGGVAPASLATPALPTQRQLISKLQDVTQLDSIPESRIKRVVIDGNPADAIVEYAADNDVDLIAMTTHGRTGLTRLLMGSVAESVVRNAKCPVMTINTGAINDDDE